MRIIIALGFVAGLGFIYLSLNEVAYRRKYWGKK